MLDDALAYAARGWAVLALSPNSKIPLKDSALQPNGSLSASTDPEHIKELWALYPLANVGIATGEKSFTAIDPDGPHGAPLFKLHGLNAPKKTVVKTPNGLHIYVQYDPELQQGARLLEADCECAKKCGIDVRSTGGYVVAPPSVVGGKVYKWLSDEPLVAWPEATTTMQAKRRKAVSGPREEWVDQPSWVSELLVKGATEGRRNDSASRLAGYFRSMNVPMDIALASMKQFADSCVPPLDYSEMQQVVQSVWRYVPTKQNYTGQTTERPQVDQTIAGKLRFIWPEQGIFIAADRIKERSEGVTCWLTISQSNMGELYGPVLVNVLQPTFDERQPKKLRERYDANWDSIFQHVRAEVIAALDNGDDMVDMADYVPSSPSPWAVFPYVRKLQPNLIFGDGGNGKTTLGVALSISMASGSAIVPGIDVKEQGNVLYLDWETDRDEFANVRDALLKGSGGSLTKDTLRYRRMVGPIEASIDRIARDVVEFDIKNVVVDSLVKAIGDDVNNAESARVFFQCIAALNTSALIFTHISSESVRRTGSDIRPYGSVFWWDYCRNNWFIKRANDDEGSLSVGLFHSKLNRGRLLKPIGYDMEFEANQEVTTSIRYKSSDIHESDILAEGATKLDRVKYTLRGGALTPAAISEMLDDEEGKIASLLRKYKGRHFVNVGGGLWGLLVTDVPRAPGTRTGTRTQAPLTGGWPLGASEQSAEIRKEIRLPYADDKESFDDDIPEFE